MHIYGFTSSGFSDITEPDMTTWKHYSGRLFVSFPKDANRELILSVLASAIEDDIGELSQSGRNK